MAKINKRLVDTADARARDYVIWDDECQSAPNLDPISASKIDPACALGSGPEPT
jgi:hypothetical protein